MRGAGPGWKTFAVLAGVLLLLGGTLWWKRAGSGEKIAQEELVARTQRLFDAVGGGDQAPWKEYFADDALYFDEKGRSMDKNALVADVTPLPKGYSGEIKLTNPQSRIAGDVAILSYDSDENEVVFGQKVRARYHSTDTWLLRREVADCGVAGAALLRRSGGREDRCVAAG